MTINSTIPYWTSTPPVDTERRLRDSLAALANRRQRAILQVLSSHSPPLSIAELVTRLVAVERETPAAGAPPVDETAVEISLIHVDLPQLTAARFVTTNREASTVELLEHPLLDDPHVERLLARDDLWDDRIAVMAVRRHRLIRAILADHADPLPRDRLAALVCAHEFSPEPQASTAETPFETPTAAAVAAMDEALHHVHLPTLADAGLVVYDPETGTVAYRRPPALDDDCRAAAFPTATATHYPVDCTTDGVAIRLVVTPDGRVDDAFACAIGESTVRTIPVPTRLRTAPDRQQSETTPTDEAAAARRNRTSTTRRREQWLIDCWLRQHAAL